MPNWHFMHIGAGLCAVTEMTIAPEVVWGDGEVKKDYCFFVYLQSIFKTNKKHSVLSLFLSFNMCFAMRLQICWN